MRDGWMDGWLFLVACEKKLGPGQVRRLYYVMQRILDILGDELITDWWTVVLGREGPVLVQ